TARFLRHPHAPRARGDDRRHGARHGRRSERTARARRRIRANPRRRPTGCASRRDRPRPRGTSGIATQRERGARGRRRPRAAAPGRDLRAHGGDGHRRLIARIRPPQGGPRRRVRRHRPVRFGRAAGAGLGAAASLDLLPAAAGELILAVARVARWAGDALAAAAELATLLYLARLITVVFVAARHARQRQASTGPSVRVAVLVPAYREEIVISRCVASLRASAYPDLQIVVIDDGSDDRTAAVAREAAGDDRRVLVLQKPNGGKASALNHGLASTDAEVIVVVDADSIVERDALAELVKPLGDPSVGAVAGNVKVGNRSNLLGAMQHLEYVV